MGLEFQSWIADRKRESRYVSVLEWGGGDLELMFVPPGVAFLGLQQALQ